MDMGEILESAKTNKYLDLDGLQKFWTQAKTYIDRQDRVIFDKIEDLSNLDIDDLLVIGKGDANNSAVLNGEYTISGTKYKNKAISQTSMALGAATTAGLKGWYYSEIKFTTYPIITLSDKQPTAIANTLIGGAWSSGTPSISKGDKISIVNNAKYDYCGTVKSISGNKIVLNETLPFNSLDTGLITANNPDDWSIYLPEKPDAGIIDFGGGAFAEGVNTKSTNIGSHAEGIQTHAYGQYSHAEGMQTEANYSAHAEGKNTNASGKMSHAEGYGTISSGYVAHAEGQDTIASNTTAHAEGTQTTASGAQSHAEGYLTQATEAQSHVEGYKTQAIRKQSHAEGHSAIAGGDRSHAEGYLTHTVGSQSHAEGERSVATGGSAHAEGRYTYAGGTGAHAEGRYSIAGGVGSHAEGGQDSNSSAELTLSSTEDSIIYTYSTGTPHLYNACFFTDEVGTYKVAYITAIDTNYKTITLSETIGSLTGTVIRFAGYAKGIASHTEGSWTAAMANNSHAEGSASIASRVASHAEGNSTTASGTASHAEGSKTTASHDYSHAEGNSTVASGWASHAEGHYTDASGGYSHAEGYDTVASGSSSHAEGWLTIASGDHSHAEGGYTIAKGKQSHAGGNNSIADGARSFAHGNNVKTTHNDEVAFGKYNVSSPDTLFSVGNGTSDTDRKNAFEVKTDNTAYVNGKQIVTLNDIPAVDTELDPLSNNPIANSAVANAIKDFSKGLDFLGFFDTLPEIRYERDENDMGYYTIVIVNESGQEYRRTPKGGEIAVVGVQSDDIHYGGMNSYAKEYILVPVWGESYEGYDGYDWQELGDVSPAIDLINKSLKNYYKKTETYKKSEIDSKIGSVNSKFDGYVPQDTCTDSYSGDEIKQVVIRNQDVYGAGYTSDLYRWSDVDIEPHKITLSTYEDYMDDENGTDNCRSNKLELSAARGLRLNDNEVLTADANNNLSKSELKIGRVEISDSDQQPNYTFNGRVVLDDVAFETFSAVAEWDGNDPSTHLHPYMEDSIDVCKFIITSINWEGNAHGTEENRHNIEDMLLTQDGKLFISVECLNDPTIEVDSYNSWIDADIYDPSTGSINGNITVTMPYSLKKLSKLTVNGNEVLTVDSEGTLNKDTLIITDGEYNQFIVGDDHGLMANHTYKMDGETMQTMFASSPIEGCVGGMVSYASNQLSSQSGFIASGQMVHILSGGENSETGESVLTQLIVHPGGATINDQPILTGTRIEDSKILSLFS